MTVRTSFFVALLITITSTGLVNETSAEAQNIKTKLIGMGSIEAGQFVRAESFDGTPIEKIWYQRAYMNFGFSANVNERTNLHFVGEGKVQYAYYLTKNLYSSFEPLYKFYPHWMEGTYSFGNIEKPWLTLGFGIFPFKYNPDVRNLGEYLYRTGTYPPTMRNSFDFPAARLTGFKISSTPINDLNLHLMLTTESDVIPLQDWGLSFLADYTLFKAVTVGAGVFFSHLLSINSDNTTPKEEYNKLPSDPNDPTDTIPSYYSFKGSKVMGRVSFDPKEFLPEKSFFKESDLRIYSEIAFIGLNNYKGYYNDIWRRRPIMVGINLPTYLLDLLLPIELLDLLSVEFEWYYWPYRNSYTNAVFQNQAPHPDDTTGVGYDYKQNVRKWSVYAKKSLGNFSFTLQFAYDHSRLELNQMQQSAATFGDAMFKHGDWAWTLKSAFSF